MRRRGRRTSGKMDELAGVNKEKRTEKKRKKNGRNGRKRGRRGRGGE